MSRSLWPTAISVNRAGADELKRAGRPRPCWTARRLSRVICAGYRGRVPLDHKPLDQLDEADLLDLVENAVAEGTTLDYKAALPGNGDEEKREFLRDATSFANTVGGHVLYGVTEEGGVPTA